MLQGDNVSVIPGKGKDYVVIVRYRKPKAADITDKAMISAIRYAFNKYDPPRTAAAIWDIYAYMGMWPSKVVRAKLKGMIKRGIIDGCVHGGTDCRGDFEIIDTPRLPRHVEKTIV